MKRRLAILLPLLVIIFTLVVPLSGFSALGSPQASAAIPSDATLLNQGKANAKCKSAGFGGSDVDACARYYVKGYKNPSGSARDACKNEGIFISICQTGYGAGQAARKTADEQVSTPPSSSGGSGATLSDAQIKALAQTNQVCAGYKDSSVAAAAFDDCVAGYIGGYKGKTADATCSSATSDTICKKGFDAGADDKAAKVTNAAEQTEHSAATVGGSGTGPDSPTCETGGDPLNWIMCPIFNGVAAVSDWLFQQLVQPLLRTTPISTNPGDCQEGTGNCTYQIWSSFRIYGNIFLVIALLVVVFGQSIGGGIIDAYTAKKILPRLIIATVLINLSIYIVAALVDITNIVGGSLGTMITAPLKDSGAFHITPSGVQAGAIMGSTAVAGTATLAAVALSALVNVGALIHFINWGLLFVIMPAFFGMLAAFLTLVLRQAFIIALVFVSPLAFALYCLPNTQQYFRKWWDFLIQTLMVYPIVIVFFAVADVLSVTAYQTGGAASPLAAVMSFVLQFLPLIFIPYAFRLAGGLLGRAHELMSNYHKRGQEAIKGNANLPNSLRNRTKGKLSADFTRSRAQSFRNWNATNDNGTGRGIKGKLGKRLPRTGAFIGGGALEAEAALIAAGKQRIGNIKDNGDDSVLNARASFIEQDKNSPNYGKRMTLDNKPVSEMEYRAAMMQHPALGDLQAAAEYRLGKVTSSQGGEAFARNYLAMAQQQGLTFEEANGNLKGLTFGKQNEQGHLKYMSITGEPGNNSTWGLKKVGEDGTRGPKQITSDFVQENYSNRSGYAAAMQKPAFHHALADSKLGFAKDLQSIDVAAGPDTPEQQHAYNNLKQIYEMQENFKAGGRYQDPETGQMREGGLTNASAGTKAAFAQLENLDRDPTIAPIIGRIRSEVQAGRTYEVENNPRGNGSPPPSSPRPSGPKGTLPTPGTPPTAS